MEIRFLSKKRVGDIWGEREGREGEGGRMGNPRRGTATFAGCEEPPQRDGDLRRTVGTMAC